ncbi:MAG: diguanylate cyclase [Gallionella sp.]|jgi:diguanylate cyclase (GGDEF)-like protein/hemerythrin-like metal-binding protein
MLNDNISWLSEPNTHDLLMQFPLPLAIVGNDGSVKLLNRSFTNSFDVSCLESDSLQKILRDPYTRTHAPVELQSNGSIVPIFVRTINIGGNTILVLEKSAESAYGAELAEMHNRIIELEKLSSTDRLTGAWNRAHFDKTIAIELSRSARYRQPLALIFFDIDHFKQVNDTYGHAVGDEVLCDVVKVISMSIRASDLLFRWGGEEFVVLAPSTSYHAAAELAETLRRKVEQCHIETAGNITISLGVAEYVAGESEKAYFQRADAALYTAKNGGRNRVVSDPTGSSDLWSADQNATILRLSWHESYDCGEPTIDGEHRQLFELANTLIESAFSRNENPKKFDDALEKLLAHVVQHFTDEEAILARYHYADLDVQVHAHKILIEHALQLRDAAAAGVVKIGELVDFLANEVVAQHMLKTDREFYPLFKKMPHAI